MASVYQATPAITPSFPQTPTALAFDPVSDILWTGSNLGNVTAYYGARGLRGVSFPVGGKVPVNKIVAGDSQVFASGHGGEGLGSWQKGGMNKWFHGCVLLVMYPWSIFDYYFWGSQDVSGNFDVFDNGTLSSLNRGRAIGFAA